MLESITRKGAACIFPRVQKVTLGKNKSGAFLLSRAVKYFAVALLLIAALPLRAAEDVEDDFFYRVEFVFSNVVFVTMHELAHVVIEDFGMPVLGNSEDAADTLAAVRLIREDRARMLLTVANANLILWQRGLEKDNPEVLLARHPLSMQRAARMNCLVFGSDPELYEPLPELVGLPDHRADWCDEEYANAEYAWSWMIKYFIQESSGTASDHEYRYGAAGEPAHESIRNWLIQNRILERTVANLDTTKVLPDTITLRTRTCGYADAYWDIEARELVLCYELINAFYQLSADQGMKELDEQLRTFHGGKRAAGAN